VQRLSYEETKEGLFFSNPSDSGQEIETFGLNKYSLIPKKRTYLEKSKQEEIHHYPDGFVFN
jgi:hypothetical protein